MQRNAFQISPLKFVLFATVLTVFATSAQTAPGWWVSRGVVNTQATPNDYAAANLGQLRWFTINAFLEMEAVLPGGAGPAVSNVVAGLTDSGQNYAAINLGQLKATAVPFYERLNAAGIVCTPPWTVSTTDDADFALANLGQLKACFSFTPSTLVKYLVIDLSGGATASSYPVSYLMEIPTGGWTDEYKTTKLVLRRIPAGSFTMGSPSGELGHNTDETQHAVTLTMDAYIGVFEVTQNQWELVMGNKPSYFKNPVYYAKRPVESVSYYDVRENPANSHDLAVYWPQNFDVTATSFMGKLRVKTGLFGFDLPTESQWEYACRAGTTTALNSGKNLVSTTQDASMAEVGRYYYNGGSGYSQYGVLSVGTAAVGSYLPNAWGLYDMHGNVMEWCLDWYGMYPVEVADPDGSETGEMRVVRGGNWQTLTEGCRSARRCPWMEGTRGYSVGFRVAKTVLPSGMCFANLDAQGGTVSPALKTVENDKGYGTLQIPVRTGYTFDGWWTAPGGTGKAVNEGTTVTEVTDHTLYAKWTANTYTATFDAGEGNWVEPKVVTFDSVYGTLPVPLRTGYTFGGWWISIGGTGTEVTQDTTVTEVADHTLYAKWTVNTYTVTFDPEDGNVGIGSKVVVFDSAYGTLPIPSRTGYAFAGWYTGVGDTGAEETENSLVTVATNHTLYAKWAQSTHGVYMVIDLTNDTKYTVTHLNTAPVGGWTDEYKTTKLVMRRIPAGTFTMGRPTSESGYYGEDLHAVMLTKDFYIGVFEVTQKQWELVMGNKPSYFTNVSYYATRPVDQVTYYNIRENANNSDDPVVDWPLSSLVNTASFMGKLRAKTGFSAFDLPTETQWEYACRAGTTTALNSGKNLILTISGPDANMDEVGRYNYNGGSASTPSCDLSAGTTTVGSYQPNAWGLYDMHGNVSEWCLDWYGTYPSMVVDPAGAMSGSFRVSRGGSFAHIAMNCRSASRAYWYSQGLTSAYGFRVACTLSDNADADGDGIIDDDDYLPLTPGPSITIHSPLDGEVVTNSPVTVSGVIEYNGVLDSVRVGGELATMYSLGNGRYAFTNSISLQEGVETIMVRTMARGVPPWLESQKGVTVSVDALPPDVIIMSPDNDQSFAGANVRVVVRTDSTNDVVTVNNIATTIDGYMRYAWVRLPSVGTGLTIQAIATDIRGRVATDDVKVTCTDNTYTDPNDDDNDGVPNGEDPAPNDPTIKSTVVITDPPNGMIINTH
jgi:uncharacterized repeat protein (TIGR02543 family)